MNIQNSNELENIKQTILNTVDAEAIYLFGSYERTVARDGVMLHGQNHYNQGMV